MSLQFGKIVKRVAVVHVIVLAALIVVPLISKLFNRTDEMVIPFEMVDFASAADASVVSERAHEPEPLPEPEPIPEPEPVPEPEPEPTPEPELKPPKRDRTIQKGRRIKRDVKRDVKRPKLSEEQIRKRLQMNNQSSTSSQSTASDRDRCYSIIITRVHGAWSQPSREAAGGRVAVAKIMLDSRGAVTGVTLTSPSGNAVLDASVLAAIKSVPRFHGLSQSFLSSHSFVLIDFKVE